MSQRPPKWRSSERRTRGRCHQFHYTNRVQRYTPSPIPILTSSNGSHNATLRPTPKDVVATSFASCAATENKTSTDAFSFLVRQRARHSSVLVPPRCGGGLGEFRISSICTTIRADSGKGVLLRQRDNAVVFFPVTCDARSASPPL